MNEMHNAGLTTKRFDIPISHLDYDYIKKCTDVKELEKIFVILKSGEEGIYLDLQKNCEDKIRKLNPNSRVLREEAELLRPGDVPEWKEIKQDLQDWSTDMKELDKRSGKSAAVIKDAEFEDESLPPIRTGVMSVNGTSEAAKQNGSNKPSGNKRVMPRDYKEWDKIDIDKELDNIDKTEEGKSKMSTVTSKVPDIEDKIDSTGMSEDEKLLKATREKEKGNEAFKAGDHAEAIVYYSRSISLQPIAASFNNRALAYLKSSNWNKAVADCNRVLDIEPDNIKALLRRGSAYKGKKDFTKAKVDIEKVMKLEPGNKRAEELCQELEKAMKNEEEEKRKKKEKGRRMVIEEVEGDDEEDEENGNFEEIQVEEDPALVLKSQTNSKNVETGKTDTQHTKLTNGLSPESKAGEKLEPDIEQLESVEKTGSVEGEIKTEPVCDNSNDSSDEKVERTSSDVSSEESRTVEKEEEAKRPVLVQLALPPDVAQLREDGNNLFRKGQFADAIQKYTTAVTKYEKGSGSKEDVVSLSLLYSNRSACNLKIGSSREAIKDASQALELVPHSIKPLLRRGAAYEELERYGNAYVDYKHILKIDQFVDMAQQGATRCQKVLQDQHGMKWREKIPEIPVFSSLDIPEIIDSTGQPLPSKVTPLVPTNIPDAKETDSKKEQAATSSQDTYQASSTTTCTSGETTKDTIPPELTTEEKFDRAKAEGNKHVQEGHFHQAIDCYNKCVDLMPERAVSFTNRALCYLRLNQPSRTEEDCNKALAIEAENVKALFRRAQARKMMKQYKESLEDLTHLLKVDPKNAAAKKELDVVKGYYREALQKMKQQMPSQKSEPSKPVSAKGGNKPRKRMVIQETSDDETETTKTSPRQKTDKSQSKPTINSSQNIPPEKQTKTSAKSDKKQTAKKSSIKQTSTGLPVVPPSAPKLEKATPYEFIQAWNSLKNADDLKLYADLLKQISPKELPTVISNKLDGAMLSKITKCIEEKFVAQGDADRGYMMLSNLCKVPRFGTITMFLSENEKQDVKNVFSKLAETKSEVYSVTDLNKLKKDYSVS